MPGFQLKSTKSSGPPPHASDLLSPNLHSCSFFRFKQTLLQGHASQTPPAPLLPPASASIGRIHPEPAESARFLSALTPALALTNCSLLVVLKQLQDRTCFARCSLDSLSPCSLHPSHGDAMRLEGVEGP